MTKNGEQSFQTQKCQFTHQVMTVSTKHIFENILALTLTLKAQRSVVIVFDAIEPVSYGT